MVFTTTIFFSMIVLWPDVVVAAVEFQPFSASQLCSRWDNNEGRDVAIPSIY